jgi:hypothetical protein
MSEEFFRLFASVAKCELRNMSSYHLRIAVDMSQGSWTR